MRRLLFAVVVALLAALPASGQFLRWPSTTTVANLPTPSDQRLYFVSDGNSATDCATGGGATAVLCWYNGASWVAFESGAHTTEVNDLSAAVTWANVPDANVSGSDERDEVCGTTDLSSGCEINAGVIVEADLNEDSGTPTDEDVLTYDSTGANFNWVAQSTLAAGTAAALASNPSDCGADTFATTIAADGDLTCEAVDGGTGGEITDNSITAADIATDAVQLAELDDDANTPSAGDFLVVETGDATVDYVTPNAGTDVTADLEEEAHESEHRENAADELLGENLGTACSENQILKANASGGLDCGADNSGGGGTPNVLDLADDSSDESSDLVEIATTGDTNSVFTEPSADKLLIDLGNNWPAADEATALSANGANCSAGQYPLGVDASGAVESCTADDDQPDSDGEVPDAITVSGGTVTNSALTLVQGTNPTPTAEGRVEWETDDDHLIVGDGSAAVEFVPAEDVSGDCTMTDAGAIECTEADALEANGANCAAGEIPLGVDASGAAEGCYEPAEADISDLVHLATAITDGLIVEADLNEDSGTPTDEDVLTYDSTGANFNWVAQSTLAAGTAAALAANGGNCSAGQWAAGVDASGASEGCTADDDVPESGDFGAAADLESTGALSVDVVAAAEMADADHGDVSWTSGVATVEAITCTGCVDASDETNLTAGTHLTLTDDDIALDAEIRTKDHCITIAEPATDGEWYTVWRAPTAITITEIYCEVTGGTSVAMDFEIDDGTPTGVNGSDITCTTSGVTDSTLAGDTGMADGDRLDVDFGTVTGSVTQASFCIEYTIDD